MDLHCPQCSRLLMDVTPDLGGKPARCESCGGKFIIPIPDPKRLLEWARTAPWDHVEEGVRTGIAQGHRNRWNTTIHKFIRICEKRRDEEIWRLELQERGEVLSRRDRIWQASERRLQRRLWLENTLEELLKMDPPAFERFVAQLFVAQGYNAIASGGTDDQGIDVKIRNQEGELWGVAQCKRYGKRSRISSANIREFSGAYFISGAAKGFYFTTGKLTRDAKKLVKDCPWLTVYDGTKLTRYIQEVQAQHKLEHDRRGQGDPAPMS